MKKLLTKRQLINIIKREPLYSGEFVSEKVGDEHLRGSTVSIKEKTCIGCAVGRVVCSLLDGENQACDVNNWLYQSIVQTQGNASAGFAGTAERKVITDEAIGKKQYLRALSIEFEGLCVEKNSVKKLVLSPRNPVKKALIKFIKADFPEKIPVDIDGLKPRK